MNFTYLRLQNQKFATRLAMKEIFATKLRSYCIHSELKEEILHSLDLW